jgi:alpha-glucosidase
MKRFIVFFSVFLICANALRAQYAKPILMGNARSMQQTQEGILIQADQGEMQIQVYASDIIRIRVTKEEFAIDHSYAVVQNPVTGGRQGFMIRKENHFWELRTDSMILRIEKNPLKLVFMNINERILNEDYPAFPITWHGTKVTSYKRLFPDEKFIGLGEKTGNLNRRGEHYENWNSDIPGYSLRQDPLYISVPFFIGIHDSLTYGIFLDNSFRTYFNFGASTDDQFSSFGAADGEMNYYFFGSSSVAGIIEDYTWLTGRMTLPPLWSLGYQQCRWGYYPASEFNMLAQKFRAKKIPCDVLYLDIDYMDDYKIFTWHRQRFMNPKRMIDGLTESGFKIVTIVDPGIMVEKGYSFYDEGTDKGYFVRYPNGSNYVGNVWPGRCHFPDFTNPTVRDWWGKSFKSLVDPGVEGFWCDMNEPSAWGQDIPDILQFDFDGQGGSMAQAHNVYGLNMARATYEGTRKLMNGRRSFVLTRAGYAGVQRYSAVWTGDNEATDEHMLLSTRMIQSMGLAGMPFAGPDIGGFIGTPSKELFLRWLSLGIYTPLFRNHAAVGTKDKEPWSFGEDAEDMARDMINQRYRLLPYLYSLFYEASRTGLPVARSLAISYPYDSKIYEWSYQQEYMLGNDLLIVPVSCTQKFVKVYLPKGRWYRWNGGRFYEGKQEVIVDAPLSDLPVFVKASGIIPLQSVIQHTGERPDSILEIHIYKGLLKNSFLWYEDDGVTYQYEQGVYRKQRITYDPVQSSISFSSREGTFISRFKMLRIFFHGFDSIQGIQSETIQVKVKVDPDQVIQSVMIPIPEQTISYQIF